MKLRRIYNGEVYLIFDDIVTKGVITNVNVDRWYSIEIELFNGVKANVNRHHNYIHPNLDMFLLKIKRKVEYAEKTGNRFVQSFNPPGKLLRRS